MVCNVTTERTAVYHVYLGRCFFGVPSIALSIFLLVVIHKSPKTSHFRGVYFKLFGQLIVWVRGSPSTVSQSTCQASSNFLLMVPLHTLFNSPLCHLFEGLYWKYNVYWTMGECILQSW